MIALSPDSATFLRRFLLCTFVAVVFLRLFLATAPNAGFPEVPAAERYLMFNVMPAAHPGFDARNIQVSAYCADQGFAFFGRNACLDAAAPVRAVYPGMTFVPVLNYPSLWPRAYRLFHDYSETFFTRFWLLNAALLIAGFFILGLKYNAGAMALFLFSPISLLAVERGNIDAATFFVTFAPLVLFGGSARLRSFFLGAAATMKIFPICGYAAFIGRKPPFLTRDVVLGGLAVVPFLLLSLSELPHMIRGTDLGFSAAFGLLSPLKLQFFAERKGLAAALLGAFVALCAASWVCLWRHEPLRDQIRGYFGRFASGDLVVFLVSAAIFLGTFFLFVSWAYRLIFVAPVFFAVSRHPGLPGTGLRAMILALFWVPLFPTGWDIANLLCFPLAAALGICAFAGWDVLSRRRPESRESQAVAAGHAAE